MKRCYLSPEESAESTPFTCAECRWKYRSILITWTYGQWEAVFLQIPEVSSAESGPSYGQFQHIVVGGPLERKRRLLANVAMLVTLCSVISECCDSRVQVSEMERVQRKSGLRYIIGCRSISALAVNILEVKVAEFYYAIKAIRTLREIRQAKNLFWQNTMMK